MGSVLATQTASASSSLSKQQRGLPAAFGVPPSSRPPGREGEGPVSSSSSSFSAGMHAAAAARAAEVAPTASHNMDARYVVFGNEGIGGGTGHHA
jgi:hypothetical protein